MYLGRQVSRYWPYWCMGELMSRDLSAGLMPTGSEKGDCDGSAAARQLCVRDIEPRGCGTNRAAQEPIGTIEPISSMRRRRDGRTVSLLGLPEDMIARP